MDKVAEVERINRERKEVRLSHKKLCERASIDVATWWRARNTPSSATVETLEALDSAIKSKRAELVEEARAAKRLKRAEMAAAEIAS